MAKLLSLPNELLIQVIENLKQQSRSEPRKVHDELYHLSYGGKACLLSAAHSCRRLRNLAFPLLHRKLELCHNANCQSEHSSAMSCESTLLAYVPLIAYLHEHPDRAL